MPSNPGDLPAFLVPFNASASAPATPTEPKEAVKHPFLTGRKYLVYPLGTMPQAVKSLGNLTPLKPANIASFNDFSGSAMSIAQIFEKTDAHAMRFENLGTVFLKDTSLLQGFSPASFGSAGQMPVIGEEHYIYPMSVGLTTAPGGPGADAMKDLIAKLQQLIQSLQTTSAGPTVTAPSQTAPAGVQTGGQQTWGLQAVKATTSQFTGKNVRVAVIDTGIDPNHPDLKARIADTWAFDNGSATDDAGHGTHVAGTIAGMRSGSLAYGVAPDAQLFIAKVFRASASVTAPQMEIALHGAIDWALTKGCQIANMSLSSNCPVPIGTKFDPGFEATAQNCLKQGLLLVAAAGNAADMDSLCNHTGVRNNPPAPVGHPANCPSVIAVGALMSNRQIAPYSCAGQADPTNGQISFAAPGDQVVSAWPTFPLDPPGQQVPGLPSYYVLDSGTSMACPHVTGLLALLCQKLGGSGGLALWQALAAASLDPMTGLLRSDVGFGMPLAVQS